MFRAAVLLALTAALPARAEYIPGSDFAFGNWEGAAYTQDDTGRFSHCAISAGFVSGDILYFSVNAQVSVSIGIESAGWGLTPGETFAVTATIDRRRAFRGTAEALTPDFAALELTDFTAALEALRRGRTLYIDSPRGSASYDLTGTSGALAATTDCARAHYTYAAAPAKVAPRGGPAPLAEAPASAIDDRVLFQVATGMIADLQLRDFRYLSADETAEVVAGPAVLWESEQTGLFGGVLTVPAGGLSSLRDSDGDDIGFLNGFCEEPGAELAVTSRDLAVPDLPAREIRSLCVGPNGSAEALLTKMLLGPEVLYTLLVFPPGAGAAPDNRSLSEDVAIRAASFVRAGRD